MGVLTILVAFEYYLFKNNFLMNTVEQMLKLYMYAHFHLVYWSQFSFYFFGLSFGQLHWGYFPLSCYIILNGNIFNLGVHF